MESLDIEVRIKINPEGIVVIKPRGYTADTFEQANRSASFACQDLLKEGVLEALDKAGVRPKPDEGGEDHDLQRDGGSTEKDRNTA